MRAALVLLLCAACGCAKVEPPSSRDAARKSQAIDRAKWYQEWVRLENHLAATKRERTEAGNHGDLKELARLIVACDSLDALSMEAYRRWVAQ